MDVPCYMLAIFTGSIAAIVFVLRQNSMAGLSVGLIEWEKAYGICRQIQNRPTSYEPQRTQLNWKERAVVPPGSEL
ncbi:hypothetical protein SKAU_G00385950 [Synaphobranchus kaupii]|uniref:Uncharacterized protein n=1 Tax=Synaphobranchus kaupii TaxID=118154 RepID=A0A9Q1EEM0_SYNKA|nr:hypothetical protein SKAU_G00385950 [Synaphobranchus kaupii]